LISLLVSRTTKKTTPLTFTKFDGKMAHGPWKKPFDFGGNPDNTLQFKDLVF